MEFSHIDKNENICMVNVSEKKETLRTAIACGEIVMNTKTIELIKNAKITKGNVFSTAKIAGIMAAKRTDELIPLCHPLPIGYADIKFKIEKNKIIITSKIQTVAKTGIEMEAIIAVSTAAATIYDMCKAVDKDMSINNIRLISKSGGKTLYKRGKIVSINTSEKRGTKKQPVEIAELKEDFGIIGDAHSEKGSIRQISLLSLESIDKMLEKAPELKPGDFAENITVSGLKVFELPVGTKLKFVNGVEMEVTKIGKTCHHDCEVFKKVGMCVMPLEGIFTKVIRAGKISTNEEFSVCIEQ